MIGQYSDWFRASGEREFVFRMRNDPREKYKVLVVDDSDDDRFFLRRAIRLR